MSCFLFVLSYVNQGVCVTHPFLTTVYYVEKRNGILRKNSGEGVEKSDVPLHGGRGAKIPKIILK